MPNIIQKSKSVDSFFGFDKKARQSPPSQTNASNLNKQLQLLRFYCLCCLPWFVLFSPPPHRQESPTQMGSPPQFLGHLAISSAAPAWHSGKARDGLTPLWGTQAARCFFAWFMLVLCLLVCVGCVGFRLFYDCLVLCSQKPFKQHPAGCYWATSHRQKFSASIPNSPGLAASATALGGPSNSQAASKRGCLKRQEFFTENPKWSRSEHVHLIKKKPWFGISPTARMFQSKQLPRKHSWGITWNDWNPIALLVLSWPLCAFETFARRICYRPWPWSKGWKQRASKLALVSRNKQPKSPLASLIFYKLDLPQKTRNDNPYSVRLKIKNHPKSKDRISSPKY